MAGNGGYQAPSNPAPVSGVGAASQRTDGRAGTVPPPSYNSPGYGEGAALQAAQQALPVQTDPNVSTAEEDPLAEFSNMFPADDSEAFDRESERPDEDISTGASYGNTPGRVNNNVDAEYALANQTRAAMLLGALNLAVQNGDPSPSTVALYRRLRAELGTPGAQG